MEMNGDVTKEDKRWFGTLLSYAKGSGGKLGISVIFSMVSLIAGLVPYYFVYIMLDRYIAGDLDKPFVLSSSLAALLAYLLKVVCFGISTGISHYVAFTVLEGLRLKVADTFLKAPLGEVYAHSIGEIKNVIIDKIEDIEPPLAHVVPEGAGHILLPIVCFVALALINIRVALAALAAFPVGLVFMMLTFKLSGKNMEKYQKANAGMSSMIVEYVEGIEVGDYIISFDEGEILLTSEGKIREKYAVLEFSKRPNLVFRRILDFMSDHSSENNIDPLEVVSGE